MKLAVYGYDTIVGKLVLEELEQGKIVIDEFFPLSPLSAEYDAVPLSGKNYKIECVDEFDFAKADAVLFLSTKDESERLIPKAQAANCVVIDNSHLFSGAKGIPSIVKDINPEKIVEVRAKKLATVPLALTSQIVLALNPLHDEFGVRKAAITALVSVSEHGELGTQTLASETTRLLNGMSVDVTDFPAQLAFNLHTRVGDINEEGSSLLEDEVKKEVFEVIDPFKDGMSLTCIQVPTFYGHTLSVHVELEYDGSVDEFKEALRKAHDLVLEEDMEEKTLVTPVSCAELDKAVYISRVRKQGRASFDFTAVMDNTAVGEAAAALDILKMLA